jgi:hypothetical protein
MTTLLEDLQDLVYQYESKKITRKTLIELLGNIVKYEEKKIKSKAKKRFWLDEFFQKERKYELYIRSPS